MPLPLNKQTIPVIASVAVFILVVLILNLKGLIPDKNQPQDQAEQEKPKREQTGIKIADIDINNKILLSKDGNIFVYDPQSGSSESLVQDPAQLEYPGVLHDGRVYFWQSSTQGNNPVYSYLYVQVDDSFIKYNIPLITNDSGSDQRHPPLVNRDGTKVYFGSDRESQTNVKHKALYEYDLTTFELTKLTQNTLMSIQKPFLSPDGIIIGFTYENYEVGVQSKDKALGLIIIGTPSVNLYPNIVVDTGPITFTQDSKHVLFNQKGQTSLFSINSGKVTASDDSILVSYTNSDQITTLKIDEKTKASFCDQEDISLNYLTQLSLSEDNTFSQNSEFHPTSDLLSPLLNSFTNLTDESGTSILMNTQNADNCQPTIAIINLESQSITATDLSDQKGLFWVN